MDGKRGRVAREGGGGHGTARACRAARSLCVHLEWAGAMTGLAVAAFAAGCAGLGLAQPWRGRADVECRSLTAGADLAAWLRYGGSHDGLLFIIPVANLCLVKGLVADAAEVAIYVACFVAARATASLGVVLAGVFFAPAARAFSRNDANSVRSFLAAGLRVQVLLLALSPFRGSEFLQQANGPNETRSDFTRADLRQVRARRVTDQPEPLRPLPRCVVIHSGPARSFQ